jgi:dGTPase
MERVRALHAGDEARSVYELTRRLITQMIADLVAETRVRLASLAPRSPDDIRASGNPVVGFSTRLAADIVELKSFLFERVYRHERVMGVMGNAEGVVADLFAHYMADPAAMAASWYATSQSLDEHRRARLIADFVAGMTDRYAIEEHRRLFDATPNLR